MGYIYTSLIANVVFLDSEVSPISKIHILKLGCLYKNGFIPLQHVVGAHQTTGASLGGTEVVAD